MAVRQLPDGRWICYYRDLSSGKDIREYFGRGLEARAKAEQRDKELNLRRGRPPRRHHGPTFAELANLYFKKKGFDRKPRESLSYRLDGAILPALGHRAAMKLTANHLEDYVTSRRLDGVKDNSIAREITDIKAILNWATRRDPPLIPFNPVRDFRPPKATDTIILPPEPAELDAIYAKACSHLKRFIALSCCIGARPGAVELLSLSWASVSWSRKTIRVTSAAKGGPESREVPIHKAFLKTLKDWHKSDIERYGNKSAAEMRIVNYWGRPVTSIKRAWKSALDGAGITRRIRPYDLRHRFVTLALENGADIGALAEIVGSRPETLRKHYQHVTAEMHRRIVNSIPGLVPKIRTKDQAK